VCLGKVDSKLAISKGTLTDFWLIFDSHCNRCFNRKQQAHGANGKPDLVQLIKKTILIDKRRLRSRKMSTEKSKRRVLVSLLSDPKTSPIHKRDNGNCNGKLSQKNGNLES